MNEAGSPLAHVIGDPIAQSKSPLIHSFWLRQMRLAGEYDRHLVEPGDLASYLTEWRNRPRWAGCNVTMPHKQAISPLLDGLDPLAQALGAVNTVVRGTEGALVGHNTDAAGFLEPLAPLLERRHLYRMARILGTGGAARAIVAALADKGFTLVLAGRDPGKARALLDELAPAGEHHVVALDHFAAPTDFAFDDREGCLDLVVNATPLGMTGHPPLAFDWSHAPPGAIAYDIVTDPVDTPFLQAARARGHPTVDGLAMLVGQAASAFELLFGPTPLRTRDDQLVAALTR
ncbi:shikimate dehydrogenase [Erythrobacter sp.]|jgi:shikimate dehydrogenase|uniref:shikimate dehydrogenase n=1 Tax=Erythrobacter sp. TaxID=1042 RepID=UPI002EB8D091|nr:shikimate dehydrogenase [Erythrobacter sp.]